MIELIGVLFAAGLFGLLVRKSLLGALLSLQVMATALILGLVLLAGAGHPPDSAFAAEIGGRARDAALVFTLLFMLQLVAAVVFATRLHYLKSRSGMAELNTLRN